MQRDSVKLMLLSLMFSFYINSMIFNTNHICMPGPDDSGQFNFDNCVKLNVSLFLNMTTMYMNENIRKHDI